MKVSELQFAARLDPVNPAKVGRVGNVPAKPDSVAKTEKGKSFGQILNEKITTKEGLRFSAHAMRRIQQSQMPLSELELMRLDKGLQKVAEKDARDSLILLDDMAYVISVKNKTVITAVDRERATDNVFTNIDSVVIV